MASATATSEQAVRLLIVGRHAVLVDLLAEQLERRGGLRVEYAVSHVEHALALLAGTPVDVVVLDSADDGGLNDLERIAKELPAPPPTVGMGEVHDAARATGALRLGARGWVDKASRTDALADAVTAVSHGGAYLPAWLLDRLVSHAQGEEQVDPRIARLTARELDVLRCMLAGLNQTAIAERLFLSPNTVRTHRTHALAKLRVHSSLEAVAVARACGVAPIESLVQTT